MIFIPLISIASCNACQNRCEHCAHQGIRDDDPAYQMQLSEVAALISRFREIDCRAKLLSIAGPGEPLLWKHFNEAVRWLFASGIADKIETTTNGKLLNIINEDVWPMLSPVYISVYEDTLDQAILIKHRDRITMRDKGTFMFIDQTKLPAAIGPCGCPGVTYYKGRIYHYCGPVCFDAFRRANVDHAKCSVVLAEYDPSRLPAMPLPCGWCWGNPLTTKIHVAHKEQV
jgi:hypothetical protein